MTKEVWKDIKGYEGEYKVSNLGRVKRLKRKIITENQYKVHIRRYPEKVISQSVEKDGYLIVGLSRSHSYKTKKVHRLVAEAFLKNPRKLEQVNHINCVKDDNRVKNLEWCDSSYNQTYTMTYNKKRRGVTWAKSSWQAIITYKKQDYYLGRFKDKEEAYQVYFDKYLELRGVKPW